MNVNAEQILNAWVESVNAGDADRVLAMYSEDATLLPTFSGRHLRGLDDIRWYFQMLGERKHVDVALREDTVVIQTLAPGIVLLCGKYDWHFAPEDTPPAVSSRFTFVVDCNAERPIQHHHSSRIPE
ncbi:MAG: SgcJ/EcaC family oxidoreductase [Kiritimatiellae bacterium]|nr:SgcJ/EcaC family oxidoreductase [Kiritimatiellia bacterium]